jgi:hypothetical protein
VSEQHDSGGPQDRVPIIDERDRAGRPVPAAEAFGADVLDVFEASGWMSDGLKVRCRESYRQGRRDQLREWAGRGRDLSGLSDGTRRTVLHMKRTGDV